MPSDAYQVVVGADHPMPNPVHNVAYHLRSTGAMGPDGFDGDRPGSPINPTLSPHGEVLARVWVDRCDLTKSRRDDRCDIFEGFNASIEDGSPIRKANRSGPGTKGTSAVEGFGPIGVVPATR